MSYEYRKYLIECNQGPVTDCRNNVKLCRHTMKSYQVSYLHH